MPSPLHIEFDADRQFVLVTYHLQPSFEEWKSTMNAIFEDPRFASTFAIVLDRRLISVPASSEYIGRMVHYMDARNERFSRLRWVVIAADDASFGMGRMAEQMVRPDSMRTFHTMDETLEWLA